MNLKTAYSCPILQALVTNSFAMLYEKILDNLSKENLF